ncbi:MAG TPA: hypothetical protein VIX35_07530 [Vicinamibacterales bacterium]
MRAETNRAEVASVRRQHPVDLTTFRNGSHGSVDQPQTEVREPGVQLESASDVRRQGRLVFVTSRRVDHVGDQRAHGRPLLTKKVVDLGKNEPGHDDGARRFQDLLVLGKT